jgi:hypothetical protein
MVPVLAEPEVGMADIGGAGARCGGFGTGLGFGLGQEMPWGWEDDVVEVVAGVGPGVGAGAGAKAGLDGALLELVEDLLDWLRATPTEDNLLVNKPFVLPAVLEAFDVFGKAGLCAVDANDRSVRKASTIMQPKMLTSQSTLLGGCRRRHK